MADKNQPSQKALQASGKSSARTELKDFMRPWAKLCAAYPRSDVGATTAAVYHERLARYDVELIMAAVNVCIERCTFFPTVAEIIENIAAVGSRARSPLLDAPRPTKEESEAVLAELREKITEFEARDLQVRDKAVADRKAELKRQAKFLGVK